jgi:hypothetical protein
MFCNCEIKKGSFELDNGTICCCICELEIKQKHSGGNRIGSGAKPKYNEPTTTIAFRVPLSKVDELKDMVNNKLSEWSILK